MALSEEIKILVKAEVDKAKRDLKSVGKDTKSLGKQNGELSKSFGGLGKTIAGAFAGAVVIRAVRSFLKSASEVASAAEEIGSKFDAVFKEQSKDVRAWAENFADSVGRATTEQLSFLATIQDTLVPLGFMRDEASDMSKQVVALATDLGSFNNLPTEEVIRSIQSALVGNTETLRRFGVVANQAAIEQEALNSGIWDGQGAISAQQKAQAILNLTIAGTADAQGDAERTSDSFANTQRRLAAEIQTLKEGMGAAVNEGIKPMITGLTNLIGAYNDAREATSAYRAAVEAGDNRTEEQNLLIQRERAKSLQDQIDAIDKYGEGQAIGSGLASDTRDALSEQLRIMERQVERQKILAEFERDAAQGEAAQAAQAAARAEQERALEEQRQARIDEQISAWNEYNQTILLANRSREFGLTTEEEKLKDLKSAAREYIETMQAMGFTGFETGNVGGAMRDALQQIRAIEEELAAMAAGPSVAQAMYGVEAEVQEGQRLYWENVEKMKEGAEEVKNAWAQAAQAILSSFGGMYSSWMSLEENRNQRFIKNLEAELEAMREQNEGAIEYKKALGLSEEEIQETREELQAQEAAKEKEIEDEKKKIAQEQFKRQKLVDVAKATQAGALAAVRAFAELGPIAGPIAAGLIGSFTAAQVGMIQAQKFPGFARGGDFVTSGPTPIMVGDNPGGRERVRIDPMPDSRPANAGMTVYVQGNNFYGTGGEDEFIEDFTKRQEQLKTQKVIA